ncbi:MAG: hypothetical protein AAGN35_25015 [Bacteroidota bacterium]
MHDPLIRKVRSFPEMGLPAAWKPLLRALSEAGWECTGDSEAIPEWCGWPILRFENRTEYGRSPHYLAFLSEPIWCGNTFQGGGFPVAAASRAWPTSRTEAEQLTLPMTGDWETEVEDFVAAFAELR